MKILAAREPGYSDSWHRLTRNPDPYRHWGQWITFDDGHMEFDKDFAQTTDIIQAEQYNGKAAKDDGGQWVPAPGPRKHEAEFDIVGFHVGLTLVGFDSDNKAIYDYSVITPTDVAFHGNGKDNTLHVPSNWEIDRIAAEIIGWICLGEDAGTDFPEDTTPEQWEWIRSMDREVASADIDEWMENHDRSKV